MGTSPCYKHGLITCGEFGKFIIPVVYLRHAAPFPHSGTTLRYKPGVIICGAGLTHDCPPSRSIGYFLEPLMLIALFAKKVRMGVCAWQCCKCYGAHCVSLAVQHPLTV